MGKIKSLSPTKRAMIVSLFTIGKLGKKEIARRLSVSAQSVRYALDKYNSTGTFQDCKRSGRPSKLSSRDNRRLVRLVEQKRRKSLPNLRDELSFGGRTLVHRSTISRRLKRLGFMTRVA